MPPLGPGDDLLDPEAAVVGRVTLEEDERPCVICYVFTRASCQGHPDCEEAVCASCTAVGILCEPCAEEERLGPPRDGTGDEYSEESGDDDRDLEFAHSVVDEFDEGDAEEEAVRMLGIGQEEEVGRSKGAGIVWIIAGGALGMLLMYGVMMAVRGSRSAETSRGRLHVLPVAGAASAASAMAPAAATRPGLIDPTDRVAKFSDAGPGGSCSGHTQDVFSKAACAAAASALGYPYGGVVATGPSGCHLRDNHVYLNTEVNRPNSENNRVLCKVTSAAPTEELLGPEIFKTGETCPENFVKIASAPTCLLAAGSLGFPFANRSPPILALKGCYLKDGGFLPAAMFNEIGEGSGSAPAGAKSICKRSDVGEVHAQEGQAQQPGQQTEASPPGDGPGEAGGEVGAAAQAEMQAETTTTTEAATPEGPRASGRHDEMAKKPKRHGSKEDGSKRRGSKRHGSHHRSSDHRRDDP